MARYKKKPIVIEAYLWRRNGDHPGDGPSTQEGLVVRYFRRPDVFGDMPCPECSGAYHRHGWIDTSDGGHRVCPGDWVITGVNPFSSSPSYYPCKSDIFDATYEIVDEGAPLIHTQVVLDGQVIAERTISAKE